MKVLAVTPMLPYLQAVNAGPLVMYQHLAAVAARHEVILATFAGPDPCEREALDQLRALGISVQAVWRQQPSTVVRRLNPLTTFPRFADPSEWQGRNPARLPSGNLRLLKTSSVSTGKRRLQQIGWWIRGRYPLRSAQFWDPRMQALLDHLVAQNTFDLIHVEDNAMGSYRYDALTRKVLTEYEVRHEPQKPPPLDKTNCIDRVISRAKQRGWDRYQPAVWRVFDRLQVFTPQDARAIQSLAPDLAGRVWVNPFGIDVPEQAAQPRRDEATMLVFVGGFWHPPNVDAALWLGREIMPVIRARRAGVRLTIVGSHPPREVRALARDNVVVTGRVPAVEPYLEQAAVVVAPVRMGGGMRLKVLQAMALGKAVVTTSIGAEGLAVGADRPPLAIADETAGFAGAVTRLLADEAERRVLGQSARAFVAANHSWSAYAERLEAMYSCLTVTSRAERRS